MLAFFFCWLSSRVDVGVVQVSDLQVAALLGRSSRHGRQRARVVWSQDQQARQGQQLGEEERWRERERRQRRGQSEEQQAMEREAAALALAAAGEDCGAFLMTVLPPVVLSCVTLRLLLLMAASLRPWRARRARGPAGCSAL